MKFTRYWLLLAPFHLLAQSVPDQKFIQEVVTIHASGKELPEGAVTHITFSNGTPVAEIAGKAVTLSQGKWLPVTPVRKAPPVLPTIPGTKILSYTTWQGGYAIGCGDGLYTYKPGGKPVRIFPKNEKYDWALRHVGALVTDSKGALWFGSEEGIGYLKDGKWKLFTGKEGVPYNHFTCAAAGPDGIVWFGTEKGAIEVDNDQFRYRFSRRWLPDDQVSSLAVHPENGTVWIGTGKGIGQITPTAISLEEKAKLFTKQVEERHNRMGFIAQSHLTEQFNVATSELAISDNDGMYTAMYGAAQAFRYAATGDPEAKKLADRSFKACKWLVDISHEKGFPARVIIPVDWPEKVNETNSHESNLRHQQSDPMWKDIYPRFPKSKDGKFYWKCDTSSDELAGHFFFYGIYYDLVAKTEEEKQAAREVVGDITDHLIRHGYKLVDHDGTVTRWGDFSPEYINSVYGYDQRGLNSMMMLSFLNVARHVTGDKKYDREAQILREKHSYHINAMHPKEFFPPENVVPWDNNLCLMSLYGLINYETDPSLLLMYRQGLEVAWQHISKQKNAFWDAIYAALSDSFTKQADQKMFENKGLFPENRLYASKVVKAHYKGSYRADFILENLQKIPLDLIGYTMDNTHRLDIVLDNSPMQEEHVGWRTDGYALPVDERGHVRQDRDGFALLASEGDGHDEHEGTFFLLPYYMAYYHGLLGSADKAIGK